MHATPLTLLALAASTSAHTIFQRMKIDSVDQGSLTGIRVPTSNNPILDVTSPNIACNFGYSQPVSPQVIEVKAGSSISTFWGHVIGGAQIPGDKDNPIASSHHGPVITYLAKVDNAATTQPSTALKWFKVQEDGLASDGTWGVDRVVSGQGWYTFTLPSCVPAGQYLMRHEIIALHSAYTQGQAQFYNSCAQINVTSGGNATPSSTIAFPGGYSATDPGILINIYGAGGVANNNNKPYPVPGPAVLTC